MKQFHASKLRSLRPLTLALLSLALLLSSCGPSRTPETMNTESEEEAVPSGPASSESETTAEPSTVKHARPGYLRLSDSLHHNVQQVGPDDRVGGGFTVAASCYLTSLTVQGPSWGDCAGSMDFDLYRWNEDYATTLKTEPIYHGTAENFIDLQTYSFFFEKGTVGPGDYMFVLSHGSENPVGVFTSGLNPNVPEDSGVTNVRGFNHFREIRQIPVATVTYHRVTEEPAPDNPPLQDQPTTPTREKAHVILLAGQRNASGNSHSSFLEQKASREDYVRYQRGRGLERIKIWYDVDDVRRSNEFVPVKLGQGVTSETFGPEIGLASYLADACPGETFYIIKCTWSSPSLYDHGLWNGWTETGDFYPYFFRHVRDGLAHLEAQGLDPELFAVCWVQGEADARQYDQAVAYGARQKDLFDRMRQRFADYTAPGGLSFVDAAVCTRSYWTYSCIVNEEKQWYDAQDSHCFYVGGPATLGCTTETDDYWHYDALDMVRLGEQLGEVVAAIFKGETAP